MQPTPAPYLISGYDPIDLDRALVHKGGLSEFVQLAWAQVEPAALKWSWHMDLVCKHLEAVSRGECRELVINVPPGMSKSLLTCVFWPAWDWINKPGRKWMFTSFDGQLSLRDAARCKDLVMSKWFQDRWGFNADPKDLERWGLKPFGIIGGTQNKRDPRAKKPGPYEEPAPEESSAAENHSARADSASEYYTTSLGLRFSTFFGGKATGWHADIQVCDDPTKPRDVQDGGEKARNALDRVEKTWRGTYSSRTADKETFARVVIMQRLHMSDLAGLCIKDGYTALILPMEFEPHARCVTPWGCDPRTEEGELLCPSRFSRASVDKMKTKEFSPRDSAAQLQQRPSPEGGAIFQRAWYAKRWTTIPIAGSRFILSVDCAFKDEQGSDWVVIQVWARSGGDYYLCDQRRGKWDVLATCEQVERLSDLWPKAKTKIVEDKANGPAVVQTLRKKMSGLILVDPEGGKVARANATEFAHRAGNVLLPANDSSWVGGTVEEWIEEHVTFPRAAHDDQVDSTSQAILWFEGKTRGNGKQSRAMANLDLAS